MTEPANSESQETLTRWRLHLEREYSQSELEGLCWRLGLDPESLPRATKTELARQLVLHLYRQGRLAELESADEKSRAGRQNTLAAYRQRLLTETRFVELRGIPLPRGRDGRLRDPHILLDNIYIQLQAIAQETREREARAETEALEAAARAAAGPPIAGRTGADFLAGLRTLGEYFYRQGQLYRAAERPQPVDPQAALAEHERLVILGPPGSGKSTLLRFLARRAAEDDQQPLPILVSLRDYANTYVHDRSVSLLDFALDVAAGKRNSPLRLGLEVAVEQGKVLWLLDALDETRLLAEAVAQQAGRLPGRLVLTSRPIGYSPGPLRPLPHYEVLPLTPEKVERFLHDWFAILAGEAMEPGRGSPQVARLQAQLADRPQLQALTRNPLLLTFLVALAGRADATELPQHRAALYARYVAELQAWEVQRLSQASGAPEYVFRLGSVEGEAARRPATEGLYYLGWALHLHYYGGRGEAAPGPEVLIEQLAGYLQQDGYSQPGELAAAVLDFWQKAGLVDGWQLEGHSFLAFRHLTFQEYAAAWGLQRAWQRDRKRTWRFLRPRLHHPAWREPILLWSSLLAAPDLNWLVHRLRRGVSRDERTLHRDLRLTAAILGESQAADDRGAQQIINLLVWLGRGHKQQQDLLLLAVYGLALVALFIFLPRSTVMIVAILWSLAWSGCFLIPVFPRLQGLFGLPLRLRGLATTPFLAAFHALTTVRQSRLAVASLLSALQDKDRHTRRAAAEALGEIGDAAAVASLLSALQDKDENVRWAAAGALGQIGDAGAVPHLLAALQDEDEYVRWAAAGALNQIGDTAVPALLSALQDTDRRVRQGAADALGEIGDAAAVPGLLAALEQKDENVPWAAVGVLDQTGDAAAVPYLLSALQDEDGWVRQAAADALGQIGNAA
ncbi:MAG: HEAT repeat domain-containing protein, partial [Chloroflexi bacterium]|nr:HEAT repeat domain-containing protein [Chloroflexota bacterium]